MAYGNEMIVKMTKEIVESAVSQVGASEKSTVVLGNTEYVTDLMQAVYDKLTELNKED